MTLDPLPPSLDKKRAKDKKIDFRTIDAESLDLLTTIDPSMHRTRAIQMHKPIRIKNNINRETQLNKGYNSISRNALAQAAIT